MTPTCATCRYFVPDEPDIVEDPSGEDSFIDDADTGTCHFHAPQPVMYCFLPSGPPQEVVHDETGPHYIGEPEGPDTTAIWPAVDAEDYCGEYKMIDQKRKK